MKTNILLAFLFITSMTSIAHAGDVVDQTNDNVEEIYLLKDQEVSINLELEHQDFIRFFVPTLDHGKKINVYACKINVDKENERVVIKHDFVKGESLLVKDMRILATSEGVKKTAQVNLKLEVKEDTVNIECKSSSTSMEVSIKKVKSYLNQVLSKNN